MPAAAGGGQKSAVLLRRTAGGQKFLSPKTPFLFACLLEKQGGKIYNILRCCVCSTLTRAHATNRPILLPFIMYCNKKEEKKFNYISLFSGAGVGCFGFKKAGYDCVLTNEKSKRRIDIQGFNDKCKYNSGYILGDVENKETEKSIIKEITEWAKREKSSDIDVLISTPPCQGMSVANHKKKNELKRNSLVTYSIRLVKTIQPKIFIFENVKTFLNTPCADIDGKNKKIREVIELNLGGNYNILYRVVNFKDYGVNSSRTRTLVMGTRKDIEEITPYDIFPDKKDGKSLRKIIGQLQLFDTMGEISEKDIFHSFRPYKEYMFNWIKNLKEGESAFENKSFKDRPYKIVNGKRVFNTNKNADKYTRCYWDKIGPCIHTRNDILASQATIHPKDNRVFSIRELMLMMNIPCNFRWTAIPEKELNKLNPKQKKDYLVKVEMNIRQCIGEAVPTTIFENIANKIKKILVQEKLTIKDIQKIIQDNKLYNTENLHKFVKSNKKYLLPEIFKIIELSNARRFRHAAYYTRQDVCFSLVRDLPEFDKKEVRILEPSVGAGNFIPLLIEKYRYTPKVIIDVVDIDKDILNITKEVIRKNGIPQNFVINFLNKDFLLHNFKNRYDIVIGNPPFGKLNNDKNLLLAYKKDKYNKKTNNLASFFIEKATSLASVVALVAPKSLLSAPEFSLTREFLSNFKFNNITDYGEEGFKGVKIETISFILNTNNKKNNNKIKIISNITKDVRDIDQNYVMPRNLPVWLIYRNNYFDRIRDKLKLDIFNVFRDRKIVKSDTKDNGKIRVLKSRNIGVNKIINIKSYDSYIDDKNISPVSKFLNKEKIVLFPNLTYNPRACFLPQNSIADGSVALLIPKNGHKISEKQLAYFGTDEFKKYYLISRNLGTRSLNIDSNSVFFIGVKK